MKADGKRNLEMPGRNFGILHYLAAPMLPKFGAIGFLFTFRFCFRSHLARSFPSIRPVLVAGHFFVLPRNVADRSVHSTKRLSSWFPNRAGAVTERLASSRCLRRCMPRRVRG